MALYSSLILLMFEKEIRVCFVVSWLGVSGMVSCWVVFVIRFFLVASAVLLIMMVIYFWECTFPPLVEIRENPEFHDLMRMDKTHWPRCLLWHGWLPMLSGCNGVSPWAGTASESAHYLVEAALGDYSSRLVSDWSPPDGYDPVAVSCIVPDYPNVWTDGSLVLDEVAGISSSGSGFFADHAASFWDVRSWGQVDLIHPFGNVPSCRGFCSVPGLFQSVQRAELWGVILALQSSGAVHLGVDNLGVVRHVGRLLDGRPGSIPFELLKDGDLLLLTDRMLRLRGLDTVMFSKVKGHADEMVLHGQVREVDWLGNNAADDAADFGRRRVGNAVIDARRNLSGFVIVGTLFSLTFIGFSLLFLELLPIMMVVLVLLLIPQYGLLVLFPRGVAWFMLLGIEPFCLDHLVFGILIGLIFLLLLFVLQTLHFGLIPLVF